MKRAMLILSLTCVAASFGCGTVQEPGPDASKATSLPSGEMDAANGSDSVVGEDVKINAADSASAADTAVGTDNVSAPDVAPEIDAIAPIPNQDTGVPQAVPDTAQPQKPICEFEGQLPEALQDKKCFPVGSTELGNFVCRKQGNALEPTCEPKPAATRNDGAVHADDAVVTVVTPDALTQEPDSLVGGPDLGTDSGTWGPEAQPDSSVSDSGGAATCLDGTILPGNNGVPVTCSPSPGQNGVFVCRAGVYACESSTPGTGGSASTGGVVGTGGVSGTGGATSSGGVTGTGGSIGTGGMSSTGGVVGTGGSTESATGGTVGTGGNTSTGGVVGTGGSVGTGGVSETGGTASTGGSTTLVTGGSVGTGGSIGTGGTAGACGNPQCRPVVDCVNTSSAGTSVTVALVGNIDGEDSTGVSNLVDPQTSNSGFTSPYICLVGDDGIIGWSSWSHCVSWQSGQQTAVFQNIPTNPISITRINYVIDSGNGQKIWGRNINLLFSSESHNRCALGGANINLFIGKMVPPDGGV